MSMDTAHKLGLAMALLLAGCPAPKEASTTGSQTPPLLASPTGKKGGAVIARFGDQTLTADEIQSKLNERSPFERARYNTLERKKELIEQLVRFELLSAEATKRGLDKDPEVLHTMKTLMARKLVQQEIDDNPAKKNIPDADLQAFYEAHKDDYQRPEMIRLGAIFLAAPDAASKVKRKPEAQKLLVELKAKAKDFSAFGTTARAKSDDAASKAVDGDLKYLSGQQLADQYGKEVATATNDLKATGQLSEVVETPKGFYLLKLTGRTAALNQTFDQAKPAIQGRLWFERRSKLMEEFIADLEKKASYSVDDKALDAMVVNTTAPQVSGVVPPAPQYAMPPGAVPPGALPSAPPQPKPGPGTP
jgi:peptidyl-prolyl cis-trans isomerase C